jgi:hypothetical protein
MGRIRCGQFTPLLLSNVWTKIDCLVQTESRCIKLYQTASNGEGFGMTAGTTAEVRADAAMAASILLLGSFLCITGVNLVERWRLSAGRRQSPDVDDLLGAFAVVAGLSIVAWWVVSMLLALAAAVLNRTGSKRAAAVAGKFSPVFMRRLALAALSFQLLSAPLANAAVPPTGPEWVPTHQVAASAAWGPTSEPERPRPLSALQPDWRPNAPVTDPGHLTAQPSRASQAAPRAMGEVTVLAGDTLWDIAARQLGPDASDVEVALHWPRWYQANVAAIGENPDVLLPGQILKSPSAA